MTRDRSQKACQQLDEQSHLAAFSSESEFKTFQKARSGSVVLGQAVATYTGLDILREKL